MKKVTGWYYRNLPGMFHKNSVIVTCAGAAVRQSLLNLQCRTCCVGRAGGGREGRGVTVHFIVGARQITDSGTGRISRREEEEEAVGRRVSVEENQGNSREP